MTASSSRTAFWRSVRETTFATAFHLCNPIPLASRTSRGDGNCSEGCFSFAPYTDSIDDYDYGSKIEFIPPEPIREGYIFGGWFKEQECINKWDFETDVLPEERTEINEDGEEEVVYQETKLYAKWL